MADFESLVQKVLTDEAFCEQLVANPEGTLAANGVEPTAEMVAAIKNLDAASIQRLATAFGKQQAA